jgi:hypothetical protein
MTDTPLITAMAGAIGSLLGAGASIVTTWITQHTQNLRSHLEWKLREREALYKEFIAEASRLAVDALTHSLERADQIMSLYAVLSRIRLISGEEVVRHGDACCCGIIEQYGQPNLTTDQLRAVVMANQFDKLDPLKAFSSACRNEMLAGQS